METKNEIKPTSQAAETLTLKDRKKQVIKSIIKGKKTKLKDDNVFDPNPEIDEKDTLVKT